MEFNIPNILRFGDKYMENLLCWTKSKFWKDIILSMKGLESNCVISHFIQVQNTPLWYNSWLNLEYRRGWVEKGYYIVKDILNEYGELMTNADLNEKGLRINFLDYENLKFKIKELMQNIERIPLL